MSLRYKGAVISATPPTTTGGESGVASGSWTLEQQFQAQGAGNWPIPFVAKYIEDVFSTYLWTGTGSNQTLTTNVDTSTYGGLFWTKNRTNAYDHALWPTALSLSGNYLLKSNTTGAATYGTYNTGDYVSNSTTGVTVYGNTSQNYVTWTFRKQPKFYTQGTYTGTGSVQNIAHDLGSVPGCIIVKDTTNAGSAWAIYHTSLGNTQYLQFTTGAAATSSGYWNNTSPTSTQFTVGTNGNVNQSGATYVYYMFAHNAGGFGLTGTDNVISCGLTTANGSGDFSVNLGYEPQWVLIKSTGSGIWSIVDNMRGATASSGYTSSQRLQPQSSAAEDTLNGGYGIGINATGFTGNLATFSNDFIYIAIRRGPMKVPTSGTSVFYPNAVAQADFPDSSNVPFPPDLVNTFSRDGVDRFQSNQFNFVDRLRGLGTPNNTYSASGFGLTSSSTGAESSAFPYVQLKADSQNITRGSGWNSASYGNWIYYFMRRAPSFFDEVCYTGNGSSNNAKTHNLGVAPELLIIKNRSSSASGDWYTFHTFTSSNFKKQLLDTTDAQTNYTYGSFLDAQPTSTTFTVNSGAGCNESGVTYVAYLFATCTGVSKVGSYTGNGSTQTINCGFTGGARFVLIKRTDSTGDWYVYDTARGMTVLTDPYLRLNSTAAESATLGSVTTVSTGFAVNASILAAINTSGASYIFLAIA